MPLEPLPIDPFVPEIVNYARERRAVVVTAAPGAGKTTRVPPALAVDGPVLLLQPRRVAARAIARRIAGEQGWSLGREVGWHVRFDRHASAESRLVVATEGILTARLQQDPLLSDVHTVVIDEFHERSIHADLGLALTRQAWLARTDLRIVVMSATIDARRVSAFLHDCPVVDVPGRLFPVDISHAPGVDVETAITRELPALRGALLCFLPGAPEIRRVAERLNVPPGIQMLQLHGGLDADVQDAVIAPSHLAPSHPGTLAPSNDLARRVILSTNLAETTLTVPDVTVVVDTGLHKVARYDGDRAIDSLETERISQDSADQRAGRAGRTGPGRVVRLWDSRDRLRGHREPEIARVDLAAPLLDVLSWGGNPRTLEWFDPPPVEALDNAFGLLAALGAVDAAGRLTSRGQLLRRFPLHPRLATMLVEARGAPAAAVACALLSERQRPGAGPPATVDVLAAVDDRRNMAPHVSTVATEIRRIAERALGTELASTIDDRRFRQAVLAGYPDRVARRRAAGNERLLLSSGTGARTRGDALTGSEFLVAVDVTTSGTTRAGSAAPNEAFIRMASSIERDWLQPAFDDVVHRLDEVSGAVRAVRVERYGAIVLAEQPARVDPIARAELIREALVRRGPDADAALLVRRLAFAGHEVAFADLVESAAIASSNVADVDLASGLTSEVRRAVDRDAPVDLPLPSGRRARLDYRDNGVVAAVKLQELFGLAKTPRLGPKRLPVTFELLAPNGRPVQVTSDLESFWRTGYQEVRKELRARYPKHPWPEDPWSAQPTHRPLRKK